MRPARPVTESAEPALRCTSIVKRYGDVLAVDGLDEGWSNRNARRGMEPRTNVLA